MRVGFNSETKQLRALILPKNQRDRNLKEKEKKPTAAIKGDLMEINPTNKSDRTKHFDKVQVDLKSDLCEWPKVRKELKRLSP